MVPVDREFFGVLLSRFTPVSGAAIDDGIENRVELASCMIH